MLNIGVVGAGIVGRVAAVALTRASHRVEIFEKSQFTNETGAAITVSPNGARILAHWDFDFDAAGAVDCSHITRDRADSRELESKAAFDHIAPTYGAFHCADLRGGSQALAVLSKLNVRIHSGTTVVEIDPDTGMMHLADGVDVVKDLIIVADGAHTGLMPKITSRSSSVASELELGKFFQHRGYWFTTFYTAEIGQPGLMLNTYACRASKPLHCGVMHPTNPTDKDTEGQISSTTVEDVLSVVDEFHLAVQAACRHAKDVKVYTNMWRDPVQTYARRKTILTGDTCHVMLSTHAQGASIALKDARAVEVLFAGVKTPHDVQSMAQTHNRLRLPRVSVI